MAGVTDVSFPLVDTDGTVGKAFGASGNVTDTVNMRVDAVSLGELDLGPVTFAAEAWGRHPNLGLNALAGRTLWFSYADRTMWVGPRH